MVEELPGVGAAAGEKKRRLVGEVASVAGSPFAPGVAGGKGSSEGCS